MSKDVDAQVQLLKTIADVTRLRILGLLAEAPRTGRELADALALSAATVSHHMGKLTEVGIVSAQVDGTRRRYSLALGLLDDVRGQAPAVEPVADKQVPQRSANEAQEVPAGEAAWLGALIRSALPASGAGPSA